MKDRKPIEQLTEEKKEQRLENDRIENLDRSQQQKPKGRGKDGEFGPSISNLMMAWGCAPSKMVLVDTKMIHDFF